MALIVQKYGGTSVGTVDRIKAVAERVQRSVASGDHVVVVVSAMAGETNRLLDLAYEITGSPQGREVDVLVSSGEQVSIALVALALQARGVPSRSFLGYQADIRTDRSHTRARIEAVDASAVRATLEAGDVAIVAGFQGTDSEGNITTLGRGGSDTTAVALAAALHADVCEIYTDVDGVFTADPNVVSGAIKIERIAFEEMLEMASMGAKVLQTRSVEFAMKYRVPIHVRSSFHDGEGTWVVPEEEEMEKVLVRAVSCDRNEARVSLLQVPDQPGIAFKVFSLLAQNGVVVDMIIQNASGETGFTDLTFTVPGPDLATSEKLIEQLVSDLGAAGYSTDPGIAKVSVIGVGMRSHSGVAARTFEVLASQGINIQMISTSEIKISVVIQERYTELAVRALHDAFDLNA